MSAVISNRRQYKKFNIATKIERTLSNAVMSHYNAQSVVDIFAAPQGATRGPRGGYPESSPCVRICVQVTQAFSAGLTPALKAIFVDEAG